MSVAPLLAVSIGCPAGIGPEVAVSAAYALRRSTRCLLVGDSSVIRTAARLRRVPQRALSVVTNSRSVASLEPGTIGMWAPSTVLDPPVEPGLPHSWAGAAQLLWINEATELVVRGVCRALVTGPVSKAVIADSGIPGARRFRGHTEHLAERLGVEEVVMAFTTERFSTALVSTHVPLRRVSRAITPEAVECSCYWLTRLLRNLGNKRPNIAVAGLNPHAGEAGLLGDEEHRIIKPGIERAKERLAKERRRGKLRGPIGADTAYRKAQQGEIDGVVAMYHDQATIACKLVGFGEAVNVTLGLPIIRTSVDHGTAYDLAGSGRASDAGMRAALKLAASLARGKR
ncbi:MAG TPA: 4-hydroxythreonine-4-phosphate dehydrogenase PdxA [Polyangiaceae bacterium]|nr:4-hydroxythreonine-4-phosphate dehydrogenase PdxA [Polyangiaceae bacterium]